MNVSLIEGKLPEEGTNQIVIHKSIAANKNLKIGDCIGKEKDNTESLVGSYVIVGIIDSEGVVSIGDYNYYKQKNPNANNGYIFEKDAYEFDNSKDGTAYQIYSYEKESKDINSYGKILRISMAVLSMFIYIIVGFMIMFMGYVFYNSRKSEFKIAR